MTGSVPWRTQAVEAANRELIDYGISLTRLGNVDVNLDDRGAGPLQHRHRAAYGEPSRQVWVAQEALRTARRP